MNGHNIRFYGKLSKTIIKYSLYLRLSFGAVTKELLFSNTILFGYKTEIFPLQNNPKNLDPFCETNLDFLGWIGSKKPVYHNVLKYWDT